MRPEQPVHQTQQHRPSAGVPARAQPGVPLERPPAPLGTDGLPEPVDLRAKLFRALGDPTRLRIVEALLERERNVSELMALLDAPQSRVSNHLMCMRWCGFVAARREGKFVYYQVTDPRVRDFVALARALAAEHAAALAECPRIDGRGVFAGRGGHAAGR